MNKTMKDVILENRKKLKMTQEELADCLNVSNKTISNWETGRSYPDVLIIPRLANVLKINVNDLFNVTDVEVDEVEKYDNDKINSFKTLITIATGLLFSPLLLGLGYMVKSDTALIIIIILVSAAIITSIILNVIASNAMLMLINQKYYYQKYASVYYKSKLIYYEIALLITLLPQLLINQSLLSVTFLLHLLIYFFLFRNVSLSKYKFKKDKQTIILLSLGILMYVIALFSSNFRYIISDSNLITAIGLNPYILYLLYVIGNVLIFLNFRRVENK